MNARLCRIASAITGVLAVAALIATAVFLYLAIWTPGPDASNWGATSFVTFLATVVLGLATILLALGGDM